MAVLAASVLSIGKLVLSYRFGSKSMVPLGRMVGSQSVTEVIWEGRKHGMHWEEGNPRPPVQQMMQKLSADLGIQFNSGSNNSLALLEAIGWSSKDVVMNELIELVSQP